MFQSFELHDATNDTVVHGWFEGTVRTAKSEIPEPVEAPATKKENGVSFARPNEPSKARREQPVGYAR